MAKITELIEDCIEYDEQENYPLARRICKQASELLIKDNGMRFNMSNLLVLEQNGFKVELHAPESDVQLLSGTIRFSQGNGLFFHEVPRTIGLNSAIGAE